MKALLGPREKYAIYWEPYEKIFGHIGYEVKVATSVTGMLNALQKPYDLVLMEIDLDSPGSYEPALEVYRRIEEDVLAGSTKFFAISDNRDLVEEISGLTRKNLKKYGIEKSEKIPAMTQNEFIRTEFKEILKGSKLKSPHEQYGACEKPVPTADA